MAFQYLKWVYEKEREELFIWGQSNRAKGKGFKVKKGRFRADVLNSSV